MMGGRRKSRQAKSRKSRKIVAKKQVKTRKSGKPWTTLVTELYNKMKKENPNTKFRDALIKASEMKKKGQL